MATVTLDGNLAEVKGDVPAVGSSAPDFRLTDRELNDVTLATYQGKRKVISINPSLDTGVCAATARGFNREAGSLDNAVVLVVTSDLPFAQNRFCAAEGLQDIVTLSMMRSRKFAKDYGVLITSGPFAGVCARAVVVLDENNKVLHSELVPEIGREPDYDAALRALF